jgi:hypothetical protein
MDTVLRYRGREVSSDDVAFISQVIASTPGASRRALSLKICEAWRWVQANGALRDGVCRALMLRLARAGHITAGAPPVELPRKVIDCRDYPSDTGCTLTIAGEEAEILAASMDHALCSGTRAPPTRPRPRSRPGPTDEPGWQSRRPVLGHMARRLEVTPAPGDT